MRVDFSDWYTRPGLVARKYTYSQMGSTRDTELEVHFSIQAGFLCNTFASFIINDLDLTQETSLRGSLRPMDDSGPVVSMTMMGRPNVVSSNEVIAKVFEILGPDAEAKRGKVEWEIRTSAAPNYLS